METEKLLESPSPDYDEEVAQIPRADDRGVSRFASSIATIYVITLHVCLLAAFAILLFFYPGSGSERPPSSGIWS
jgi:hypothetical protein